MKRRPITAVFALGAFAVSALMIEWLRLSSEHADRPPLFAVAAFLLAVIASGVGLLLCVRLIRGARQRGSH